MDTGEKILAVFFIGMIVFAIAALMFSFDGDSVSMQYCEEWGGKVTMKDPGKLFVWGDWTAVCIDRNPDRILYISGEK